MSMLTFLLLFDVPCLSDCADGVGVPLENGGADMLEQNSQELQQNGIFLLLLVVEIVVAATYSGNH
jgi:hypothetical protein